MGRPQTIKLSDSTVPARHAATLRRIADVALSMVLLVLAAPVMVAVALLVRATSHGPVLRRHPVAGRQGAVGTQLAFRTTVDGGATEAHARMRAVVGATDAYTPVGRHLRALKLDRLPRLINVLRGDASLFNRS